MTRADARTRRLAAAVLCVSVAVATPAGEQDESETLAARRYESGLQFARDGNHDQALADFSAVVDLYPASAVADNAILEVARHHLEVSGDATRARAEAERIVNDPAYSQGDAAPGAYLVIGRAAMAASRTDEAMTDALASFQRGVRLYPDAAAVPEARYRIATVYQRSGRLAEALEAYQLVVTEHPRDPWGIRARLGVGTMIFFQGDAVAAMEQLQRIRDEFPERPEATEALALTTTLYRLYLRPAGATYAVAPATGDPVVTREVIALAAAPDGAVVAATEDGVTAVTGDRALPAGDRLRGLAVDPSGDLLVIERGGLARAGGEPLRLAVPDGGEPRPLEEIDAAVALSTGEWLIADRVRNTVQRFAADGGYIGPYAPVRAVRLAIDPEDQVAVLDNDDRIYVYVDGRQVAQITTRAQVYRIDDPVDVAFDALGHLYVLDRDGLFVFGRDRRFLTAFPGEVAMPPFDRATALAIDRFGRLYVADDRDDQIFRLE